ncbi:uncharacterized protein G2W53_041994 [Senna tora]|uniref:Uncharacterized protein n=1 Tax=Senna tora TaxID=362788 RepID=A0A834SFJ8_9FABA|nr:uncharacterized protein G2W53_041994 [Senna tora]
MRNRTCCGEIDGCEQQQEQKQSARALKQWIWRKKKNKRYHGFSFVVCIIGRYMMSTGVEGWTCRLANLKGR